ncbi:AAA family ATPase [Robertmurraya massiliosenegalensis]|uniref:AAA family ATPase n=1 Tax=Robertmurraya TaxID=2837507 RepID=UPI0039A6326B
MQRFTLYTYKNRNDFECFYKEKEDGGYTINPFIFQDTRELLEENPDSIIDLSNLVEYLSVHSADLMPAMNNLIPANDETHFIIKESLSEKALDMFHLYFKQTVPIYPIQIDKEQSFNEFTAMTVPFKRMNFYSYKNSYELTRIIEYLNNIDTPLVSFSQLNDDFIEFIKTSHKEKGDIFVDITSLVSATKDNSNLIYYAERIMIENPNFKVVTHKDKVNETLDVFRLIFDEVRSIDELIQIETQEEKALDENKTVRIVDLSKGEVEKVIKEISENLFGHKKFKDQLSNSFNNFVLLNRMKEKKVFSMFLLGDTGLGKSEFASLLKKQLNPSTSLVKINFGNYSSQDALNSLIGSPRGYIGSEEGELSNKIVKSKAGVILCDEFEKANKQIFNFFLELLEDGVFTDSLSREHDLDGYVIIFTSNLDKVRFTKEIPAELQSRLDLICEFSPLTRFEKSEFVNYFVENFVKKIENDETLNIDLSTIDMQVIKNINVEEIGNIRDIKRILIRKILQNTY